MSNSQYNPTPVNSDSTESNDILMPGGVMNVMLDFEAKDAVKVSTGPLVPTLFNAVNTRKLKALLTAIVDGKPDEVKALLDENPSLVLEKLEEKEFVTSLSEHKFNLKPYQAALSVEDTQMAALVRSYFKDEKEADRQYEEQCPKGLIDAEQKKWQLILEQRKKLTLAIRDSKPGDITSSGNPDYIVTVKEGSLVEKELHEFWKLLDATKDNVITAGKKAFNADLLLKAWQTYDDEKLYQEYFGGRWDDPRALLFWQKVIGYDGIQRIMPVNYVQAFQDWLDETVKKLQDGKPQARGTRFEIYRAGNYVPVDFYPLQPRGSSDFNFAIYGGGGRCGAALGGFGGGWGGEASGAWISKLMSIKNSRLTELMPRHQNNRLDESTKSSCIMM